ncbi:MAG: hypothetical protein HYY06_14655 [Deltaproteobacteria bacterium]|nr:hypothetical protein [Deltaproteobacteria bacterium]
MTRRVMAIAVFLVVVASANDAPADGAIGELFEIDLPRLEGVAEPDSQNQEPEQPQLSGAAIRWDGPELSGSATTEPESLWRTSLGCDAAGLAGAGQRLRRDLVSRFPASSVAPRTWQRLGAGALALARHADAASAFEELARRFPAEDGRSCTPEERVAGSCPLAAEALWNATVLRLALGDRAGALADATLHQKLYARRRPRETSTLLLAVAAEHAWASEPRAAAGILDHLVHAEPDIRIRALVDRAAAREALGERRRALADLGLAEAAWEALGGTAEAVAADAAAEGRFRSAQLLARSFEELELPRFGGPRTAAAIVRWSRVRLAPWIRSALADLRQAEIAFGRVVEVGVPRWTIAALARVGQLRRHLHDLVRQVPRPPMDPQLERIYLELISSWGDTFADLAADAFRACLARAAATREHGHWSATCAAELDSLDPRRSLPELRPEPVASDDAGLAIAPLPLGPEPAPRPGARAVCGIGSRP